jgi:hypothetical protein
VRGFWVSLADKVAPALKPLLDRFANLDFASWGQKAGEAVAFIVQAFADGKVGDIFSLGEDRLLQRRELPRRLPDAIFP